MKNKHVEYTSIADLIAELKQLEKEGYGDYPVCVNGVSPIFVSSRPFYYDGGYLVRDVNKGNYDYLRSRVKETAPRPDGRIWGGMRPGVKDKCFDLMISDPTCDEDSTIDGRTVREMDPETWSFLDVKEQEEMAIFGGLVKYQLLKVRDEKLDCYPFRAYLDSGVEAIGSSMSKAKKALEVKIKNDKL